MTEPIFKPNDDHWVKTRTDQYLYAAAKLNASAAEFKKEPTIVDYEMMIPYLLPAVKEQLVVFDRLAEELKRKKFPWDMPGFVLNPSLLIQDAQHALGAGQVWTGSGRPELASLPTFRLLSQAFINIFDCCMIIRRELGWMPPHMEEPPLPPPPLPPDEPRSPITV